MSTSTTTRPSDNGATTRAIVFIGVLVAVVLTLALVPLAVLVGGTLRVPADLTGALPTILSVFLGGTGAAIVSRAIIPGIRQRIATVTAAKTAMEEANATIASLRQQITTLQTANVTAATAHDTAIVALKREHHEAVDALKTQHVEETAALVTTHAQVVEELEARHAAEVAAVREEMGQKLADAEGLLAVKKPGWREFAAAVVHIATTPNLTFRATRDLVRPFAYIRKVDEPDFKEWIQKPTSVEYDTGSASPADGGADTPTPPATDGPKVESAATEADSADYADDNHQKAESAITLSAVPA